MQEIQRGVYAYDPADTKLKFHFHDGSILEPYGFAEGEHMWLDDGSVFLKIQSTSSFVGVLLERMLELGTNEVKVEMTSNHAGINRVLSQLDGSTGEIKMLRVGLRSTNSLPTTLIEVILSLSE